MKQLAITSQTIQDMMYRQVSPHLPMETEHWNGNHWTFWTVPASDCDLFGDWLCLLCRTDCGVILDEDIPDIITPMETAIWRELSRL